MQTTALNRVPLRLLGALALVLLGGPGGSLFAQETNAPAATAPPAEAANFGRVKDFYVPDYYEAPHQNQMKSLLRGAEAEPQPNGRVLIHELLVETYNLDGTTELVVRAPECVYNSVTQTASSTGRIEARSGDGKMLIRGEGFLWQQTNSLFTISNRVHTIIRHSPDIASQP